MKTFLNQNYKYLTDFKFRLFVVKKYGEIDMVSVNEFPISTANDIPGFKIVETKGFVYGLTVRSRGAGGQIGAGVKSLFGGEIKQYVTMMEESRDDALDRVIDHAKELGANAIIAIRFDSNEISNVMQEILVYGTAVVVEKE